MESDIVERVDRDHRLTGDEKETSINMYGSDKYFKIYSAKPTIIKSLLKHDHFELELGKVLTSEEKITRVSGIDSLANTSGKIVGVKGKMPIGTLTVKSKPRANNHQSSIVNHETIDSSVFDSE